MRRLLTGLLLIFPLSCWAESLTVSYLERPPYYYTDSSGAPAGVLLERTQAILKQAQLEARYFPLPANRILYVLRNAKLPHCSIGWFKTVEREQFARFSLPIYQDQPPVLLILRSRRQSFGAGLTLRAVFADRALAMARMSSFSYGPVVDQLLEDLAPASLFLSGQQSELLNALVQKRADYMLIAPEEVKKLVASSGLDPAQFVTLPLSDLQVGNYRYLMCSQGLAEESMARIDMAIRSLYPEVQAKAAN